MTTQRKKTKSIALLICRAFLAFISFRAKSILRTVKFLNLIFSRTLVAYVVIKHRYEVYRCLSVVTYTVDFNYHCVFPLPS
ncbi:hypothetical protein BCR43DRAFT_483524 [Syncephalastrum racemosum]|uniref:Uncharacterized protein n=1 Tax=Syncephalastrum racemosum TaxID=13706 RepID=A0A1X2HWS0_SYNRA|nr:hypothetical protein BCR43DRAFT_483524 [Syncephalastrum racemosum]